MVFRRNRDVDIQPGQTFHLPGAQQKNMQNLLNILSKREATEALAELGKTTPDTWSDIKESTTKLNRFIELGGASVILEGFKETVDLQIADALAPLRNEINQLISEALAPFDEKLNEIFNNLSIFIAENSTGAAAGGIAGSIAAMFLPGGPIIAALVTALGAVVGAQLENLLVSLLEAETPEEVIGGTGNLLGALGTPGLGLGFGLGSDLLAWLFGF